MIPFLPYRTMRDHFLDYPLGGNVLDDSGRWRSLWAALIHGKRLPKSKLYGIWLIFGVYLYFSMWFGYGARECAPAPTLDFGRKLCDMERLHADSAGFCCGESGR